LETQQTNHGGTPNIIKGSFLSTLAFLKESSKAPTRMLATNTLFLNRS
jgi:hypothetical protein